MQQPIKNLKPVEIGEQLLYKKPSTSTLSSAIIYITRQGWDFIQKK